MASRNGIRDNRNGLKAGRKSKKLKNRSKIEYIFITEGKVTEKFYLNGLIDSVKKSGVMLSHTVIRTETKDLLLKCESELLSHGNNAQIWVVTDKDDNSDRDFNKMVKDIEGLDPNRAHVAWSNPCLEIWFLCHFDQMPTCNSSRECVSKFGRVFEGKKDIKYDKSEKTSADLYSFLTSSKYGGDENKAVMKAKQRHNEHERNHLTISAMNPGTTMYILIEELRNLSGNSSTGNS